jgi:hypothetical protein
VRTASPPPRRNLVTFTQALEARPWLSRRLLRRIVEQRRVPYFKTAGESGLLLFDLNELDRYIEDTRIEALDRTGLGTPPPLKVEPRGARSRRRLSGGPSPVA